MANPQHNDNNIFELHFKLQNQVNEHYNTLLNWCHSAKELFTGNSKTKRNTNTMGLRAVEADLSNDKNHENNLAFLELQLENQQQQIDSIENKLNGSMQSGKEILIIPDNILVRNVIINNEVLFNELIGESLNDLNIIAFLSGIVPIEHPMEKNIERLELQAGTIENFITAGLRNINGRPQEDLLHKNVDNLVVNDLVINGNFWVTNLQVKGLLNGLQFNTTNVLLREGDQFFLGNLSTQNLIADNVTAKFLNNLNLHSQPQQAQRTPVKIFDVDTLRVKHLTIAEYMNNVDLPTLNKFALKTSGNQEITGDYIFNELSVKDFQTQKLNNISIPEDLVRIDKGEYFINQDVKLEHDLQAQNLQVRESLNNIIVLENGELDVLRKNTTEMQFIDGKKTIEEVELLKPMLLQGKIDSKSMQKLNPVTKISEPMEFVGDYFMSGLVTIEDQLLTPDLGSEHYSISNLKQNGLKLTEEQVPVHLNFAQQLNTDEIFAEKINDIDTHRWVVNGQDDAQYIKGWKTFNGDLTITGDTNIQTVNQITLSNLFDNVLTVDGDQIITGKHEFKTIVAGTIKSPHITLQSQHTLEEMLTQDIQQDMGDVFIGQHPQT